MERAGLGKAGGGRRSRLAGNRQETQLLPQNKSCRRAGARPAPSARWVLNPSPAWHVEASPMGVWLYSFFFFTLFFQPSPSNPSKTHFKKKKKKKFMGGFFFILQIFWKTKDFAHFAAAEPSEAGKFFQCHKFANPNPKRLGQPPPWESCWRIVWPFLFKKKTTKKNNNKKTKKATNLLAEVDFFLKTNNQPNRNSMLTPSAAPHLAGDPSNAKSPNLSFHVHVFG